MNPPSSLLEATFLHAQGIGRVTEQRLWQAGATDWNTYLADPKRWPLTAAQRALLTPAIEESKARLEQEDFRWFAQMLPAGEHWRAVPAFGHRLAFLDIETNGGQRGTDLTLVGLSDGWKLRQFVQGRNLELFPDALAESALIVTFFGTGFDLPFLRRAFPNLAMPQMHVDLCYVLKRLGYRGGLKSIEPQFGIVRSAATAGLSGWDAVRLWREYRKGNQNSLNTLLEYNADDVRNMAVLLTEAYRRMARQVWEESSQEE